MSGLLIDFRPFRGNKDFTLLFAGQFVSLLGSNLTTVAIPYQIYLDTHSSLWVGITSLIQLPLLIIGSLWGGAVGDRVNRRLLLSVTSLGLGMLSVLLGINAQSHSKNIAVLIVLAALSAGLAGFLGPLRSAVIPTIVPPDQLLAANSLFQLTFQTGFLVGPAIAGVLIAAVGVPSCYLIDACTFAMLSLSAYFLSPLPPVSSPGERAILKSIRDGFSYVRKSKVIQGVYLVDLNAMIFGMPRALFPAFALSVYHAGPRALGLLFSAPAIGGVLISLISGWVNNIQRQGRIVVLSVIAWGVAIALFGAVHVLWLGVVFLAIAGGADALSAIFRNTILQSALPDEYRSRIASIQIAVVTGGPRIGDMESGVVAGLVSTEFSVISGGIACVLGALVLIKALPTFWQQEKITLSEPE